MNARTLMPHRRWFQFSTRGLLLLLTGLCMWLGYLTESARRQRDAVTVLAPVARLQKELPNCEIRWRD